MLTLLKPWCVHCKLKPRVTMLMRMCMQENLMSSLAHTPLQSLNVDIFMEGSDPQPEYSFSGLLRMLGEISVDPEECPLLFTECSADELDLEGYVRRFSRLVPTLQRAKVRMNGHRGECRCAELEDGEVKLRGRPAA